MEKSKLGTLEQEREGILDEIYSGQGPHTYQEKMEQNGHPTSESRRRRCMARYFAEAWVPYLNAAGLIEMDAAPSDSYTLLPKEGLTKPHIWAPLWAIVYLRYSLLGLAAEPTKPRLIKDVAKELMDMSTDLGSIITHLTAARLSPDNHTRYIAQKALEWAVAAKRSGGMPLPEGTIGARPEGPKEEDG